MLAAVNGQNTTLMSTVINTIVQPYPSRVTSCSQFIASNSAFAKNPEKLPELHHQVGLVLKLVPDARQQAVFLRSGEEDDLPFDRLMRGERCRGINERGLDALQRRRARHRLDVRERRQINRPGDDLRRRLLRHRHQREKLVVRRRPNHVVRAGQIFRTRRAADSSRIPSRKTIPPSGPDRLVPLNHNAPSFMV